MSTPTDAAVIGQYISRGDDFLQLENSAGQIVSWINAAGYPQGNLTSGLASQVEEVGHGSVLAGQLAVTTTASSLPTNSCRLLAITSLINNSTSTTLCIGAAGVTTSTGFPLNPGDSVT